MGLRQSSRPSGRLSSRPMPVHLRRSPIGREPEPEKNVTVCVAAIGGGAKIFLASDRMITSGDVEFEPTSIRKVEWFTNSIVAMWAGEAAYQREVLSAVSRRVRTHLQAVPNEWLKVRDVAGWYADEWAAAKRRRAELAVLAPLGLTFADLHAAKHAFSDEVIKTVLQWLADYTLPDEHHGVTACIIAGADTDNVIPGNYACHLYRAINGTVSCEDAVGFAAIGAGARHANSHFMQAAFHPTATFEETLWLTYSAKRRAEAAPGVGAGTDISFIEGPGTNYPIASEHIVSLDTMFAKVRAREARERRTDTGTVKRWLDKVINAQATTLEPVADQAGDAKIDT